MSIKEELKLYKEMLTDKKFWYWTFEDIIILYHKAKFLYNEAERLPKLRFFFLLSVVIFTLTGMLTNSGLFILPFLISFNGYFIADIIIWTKTKKRRKNAKVQRR